MTRKQYRKKQEYIKGYRRGYQTKGLSGKELQEQNNDFKRGYIEGRKDLKECEPALY